MLSPRGGWLPVAHGVSRFYPQLRGFARFGTNLHHRAKRSLADELDARRHQPMQIEMTIKGLMVDPITNMPIIILRDKAEQRVLPIWVGVFEANAIALQIENVTTPRPMTHDLLRKVIHDLKADIQKIVVSDLKDNTFYALIYLSVNGEAMAIDARPSDAIALALRARAPIFVEDTVIDNAKTVDFAPEKRDTEQLQKWLESLDPDDMGKYKM
jgi:bifunctional DNase/RNase